MKDKRKAEKQKSPWRPLYFGGLTALGFIVLISLIGGCYAYLYQDKVLLNSYLQDKNVSSYQEQSLKIFIDQLVANYPDKKIKVAQADRTWEIDYADFAWQVDKDKTAQQILSFGHSGEFLNKVEDTYLSLVKKKNYSLIYEFDEAALDLWINQINLEIGKQKEETNIVVKNSQARLTQSKPGEKIEEEVLRDEILKRLALQEQGEIKLQLIKDEPQISKEEAEALVEMAKELTKDSVKLKGPKGEVELTSSELGGMIELKKKMRKTGFLKSELGPSYVSFSDKKIKAFLQKNLDELNIPAEDARFTISSGTITLTSASKTGEQIKLGDAAAQTIESLEKGQKVINLPTEAQEPSIKAQSSTDIEKIGIRELIGTATTDFKKSPENRIHNIKTGVKYISGAVIKPGEEFSTVKRLGNIDQSGGYLPELVIKENSTVPEFGGGLCQVSTTLFRAAMNSGLKITERQNHSYRVSYYEPPVGMDATIYNPRPDFKFINTTDNYILVNGYIDGTKITFDFYGTKDGRVATVSEPNVYDVTAPPEPIYIDDPTLAPGEVKKTDSAHPGAKASFNYTVTKEGKVINQQTFNSYYVAWPAKYLRGPEASSTPEGQ